MGRFSDKVALVTGAGTGLGKAAALAFAEEGARVVLAGRTAERLTGTAALIEAAGGKALVVTGDVTVEADVARMVRGAVETFGQLDVAFNNAGVITRGTVLELQLPQVEQMLAINVTGTWLSMKHEIPAMLARGGGAIVNMASVLGKYKARPGSGIYGAAKAGVLALTEAAALEHAADNIRVNAVSPGMVGGPMSRLDGEDDAARDSRVAAAMPVGRMGSAEEVAAAVLWLASDDASYVTGRDIVLDGASTL